MCNFSINIYCNKPTMCQKIWIQQNKKKIYIYMYFNNFCDHFDMLFAIFDWFSTFADLRQHSPKPLFSELTHFHYIFIIYIFFYFYSFYQMFCMMWQENNKIKQKRVILFNKGSWIRRLTAKLLSVRSVRCQKYGQIVKINCDSV